MSEVINAFQRKYGVPPKFIAKAPGRVEFIGNHTDYNGGEVLGAAVDRFLHVAVSPREDSQLVFTSSESSESFSFPDCERAVKSAKGWIKYPAGVLSLLAEAGIRIPSGFDFLVTSEIPSGAGLSSSAAFELASSIAFESLAGRELDQLERVRLCRRAENEVVGVPCGILDQGVSGFGEKNRLVHIDCAEEKIRTVDGPLGTRLWIFESGVKHSLVDSLYSERHRECRNAFDLLKKKFTSIQHLVDVSPQQLQESEDDLPLNVYCRARHVVEEHQRVRECVRLLEEGDLEGVGRLLDASHWSSSRLFENSVKEIDALVRFLAADEEVLGARLTGGGFGGAVMALCRDSFSQDNAEKIVERFHAEFGVRPKFRALEIAEGARREL